jgi:hypothetical protein
VDYRKSRYESICIPNLLETTMTRLIASCAAYSRSLSEHGILLSDHSHDHPDSAQAAPVALGHLEMLKQFTTSLLRSLATWAA